MIRGQRRETGAIDEHCDMNPFDIDKYISEQLYSSMGVSASALQSTNTSFNAQSLQKLIDSLKPAKTCFYPARVRDELEKSLGIDLTGKDVVRMGVRYIRSNYVEDIYVVDSDILDVNKWKVDDKLECKLECKFDNVMDAGDEVAQ